MVLLVVPYIIGTLILSWRYSWLIAVLHLRSCLALLYVAGVLTWRIPIIFFLLVPWVEVVVLLLRCCSFGALEGGLLYLLVLRLIYCVGSVFDILGSLDVVHDGLLFGKSSLGVVHPSSIIVESWRWLAWVWLLSMFRVPRIVLLLRPSSAVYWCLRLLGVCGLLVYRSRCFQLQFLTLPIMRLLILRSLPFLPSNWRIELALLRSRILKCVQQSIVALLRHHNNILLPWHLLRERIKLILFELKCWLVGIIIEGSIIRCFEWLTFWRCIIRECARSTFVGFVDEDLLIVVLGHVVDAEVGRWEYLSNVELVVSVWSSSIESCVWMPLSSIVWFLSLDGHDCLLQGHAKNMLFCDTHRAISLPALFDDRDLLPLYSLLWLNTRGPWVPDIYAVVQIQVMRIVQILLLLRNLHTLIHLVLGIPATVGLLYLHYLHLWFWWWSSRHWRLRGRIIQLYFSVDSQISWRRCWFWRFAWRLRLFIQSLLYRRFIIAHSTCRRKHSVWALRVLGWIQYGQLPLKLEIILLQLKLLLQYFQIVLLCFKLLLFLQAWFSLLADSWAQSGVPLGTWRLFSCSTILLCIQLVSWELELLFVQFQNLFLLFKKSFVHLGFQINLLFRFTSWWTYIIHDAIWLHRILSLLWETSSWLILLFCFLFWFVFVCPRLLLAQIFERLFQCFLNILVRIQVLFKGIAFADPFESVIP